MKSKNGVQWSIAERKLSEMGYLPGQVELLIMDSKKTQGVSVFSGVSPESCADVVDVLLRHIAEGESGVAALRGVGDDALPGVSMFTEDRGGWGQGMYDGHYGQITLAMKGLPDVLSIGPISGELSVKGMREAVVSRIKVYTTVDADEALLIPTRLSKLGLSVGDVAQEGYLSLLVSQSSLPELCDACALPVSETVGSEDCISRLAKVLPEAEMQNVRFRNKLGCEQCCNGAKGITAVAEVVSPGPEVRQCLLEHDVDGARRAFVRSGGMLKIHVGLEKVRLGLIDPLELESKVGLLDQVI
jgi:hypothetical protein